MRYVRRKHNILIGKRTAEELKIGIACLVPRAEVGIQEVKGRCLTTGLPKSMKISSVELVEAIAAAPPRTTSSGRQRNPSPTRART